jgi:hypothetical protein
MTRAQHHNPDTAVATTLRIPAGEAKFASASNQ